MQDGNKRLMGKIMKDLKNIVLQRLNSCTDINITQFVRIS